MRQKDVEKTGGEVRWEVNRCTDYKSSGLICHSEGTKFGKSPKGNVTPTSGFRNGIECSGDPRYF